MAGFFSSLRCPKFWEVGALLVSVGTNLMTYAGGVEKGRTECAEALKDSKQVDKDRDEIDKNFFVGAGLILAGMFLIKLNHSCSRHTVSSTSSYQPIVDTEDPASSSKASKKPLTASEKLLNNR